MVKNDPSQFFQMNVLLMSQMATFNKSAKKNFFFLFFFFLHFWIKENKALVFLRNIKLINEIFAKIERKEEVLFLK